MNFLIVGLVVWLLLRDDCECQPAPPAAMTAGADAPLLPPGDPPPAGPAPFVVDPATGKLVY